MEYAHEAIGKKVDRRVQVQLDMPFYRDWGKRTYVMMLDNLIRDHKDGHTTRSGTLPYCVLDALYDRLLFLRCSRIWREAVTYKKTHRAGDVDGYFFGWHNREIFKVSLEEWAKPYVRIPDLWNKYEPCRVLLVLTSLLFAHAFKIFLNHLSCAKALYRTVVFDYFVLLIMSVLQRIHPTVEEAKISLFGFDLRIRENVYKGMLFLLPDAVVGSALEAGVDNVVEGTRYSPVRTHTAVVRSSRVDWDQSDCPGWYSYGCRTADVFEVPPTHRGGCNCLGSKPSTCGGVKVVNLIDLQAMFDENENCSGRSLQKFQKVQLEMVPRLLQQLARR